MSAAASGYPPDASVSIGREAVIRQKNHAEALRNQYDDDFGRLIFKETLRDDPLILKEALLDPSRRRVLVHVDDIRAA